MKHDRAELTASLSHIDISLWEETLGNGQSSDMIHVRVADQNRIQTTTLYQVKSGQSGTPLFLRIRAAIQQNILAGELEQIAICANDIRASQVSKVHEYSRPSGFLNDLDFVAFRCVDKGENRARGGLGRTIGEFVTLGLDFFLKGFDVIDIKG